MSDDDPVIVCCILGICCPTGSEAQLTKLASALHVASGNTGSPEVARAHAQWLLRHFDLAPAGSLAQFKDAIATHARKSASRG